MLRTVVLLLSIALTVSLAHAQEQSSNGKVIVSVAGKKDVEKVGRKMCEVTFNIQNNSFGTINGLGVRVKAENDRGQAVRGFGIPQIRNVKRFVPEPISKGGVMANAKGAIFEEECKYLKTVSIDRNKVDESSCNVRMMPEDSSCKQIVVVINAGETVASSSNSIFDKLVKGMVYKYYSDGSCKPEKRAKCLNKSEYEQLCKNSDGMSKNTVSMAAVMYRSEYAQWIRSGSSRRQLKTQWSNGRCMGGFTATGIWRGTNRTERIYGAVNQFVYNQNGALLVHSVRNY